MKTLYLTNSSANIAIDPEENTAQHIESEDRYDIRNIYYAEEPMHVIYSGTNNGEPFKEEIDAKKGDIILVFYTNRYNKKLLATIKSKEWAANIKNRHEIEQKEREEWAAKNAENTACPCCDCDVKCECAG
jgi:hypothetical protein